MRYRMKKVVRCLLAVFVALTSVLTTEAARCVAVRRVGYAPLALFLKYETIATVSHEACHTVCW
jgi:hypothetical protein